MGSDPLMEFAKGLYLITVCTDRRWYYLAP